MRGRGGALGLLRQRRGGTQRTTRSVRRHVSGRHVAAYKDYLLILPKNQVRVYLVPRATTALPHSTRKMRQADDDDEGIEMGGTLDPEDGLQGIASKARPMPKW